MPQGIIAVSLGCYKLIELKRLNSRCNANGSTDSAGESRLSLDRRNEVRE
jgi:hypothetical protein